MTELLSPDDAAQIVRLSAYTVRQAIREGELRASKLRGRLRIHPDDLAAWIDQGRLATIKPAARGTAAAPLPARSIAAPPAGSTRDAVRRLRRVA